MNAESAYLCRGDWGYCVTDSGSLVPHICPECGSGVRFDRKTDRFECGNGHILGTYENRLETMTCMDYLDLRMVGR